MPPAIEPGLQKAFADHDHRAKYGTRYAQSPAQFAQGAELMRRITGESLDFKPNADRYECKDGQYLLDLPRR